MTVFTLIALASPYLTAAGAFAAYLRWISARGGEFVEDFLPEPADVAAAVAAVDQAMVAHLKERTA